MTNVIEWTTIAIAMCAMATNSIGAAISCCGVAGVIGFIGWRLFNCWR